MNVDPKKLIEFKYSPEIMQKHDNTYLKESFEIETINEETKLYYVKFSIPMISDRDNVL